ncbi:MAG: serine acetyltransferase [Rhodospirillales bacterium]|nr:serine acetyltransferase [Rhodospirillales bacterium]
MRLSIEAEALASYVAQQVSVFFPDNPVEVADLLSFVNKSLDRVEACFSPIRLPYYFEDGSTAFDHHNTDHYACFLYYLSNTLFRESGDPNLTKRVYALNKLLHSLDIFYEIEMPDVFVLAHPVGTVLGRARYGNYLCVYQGCTVGANTDGVYPTLGEGIVMYPGSQVVGDCRIGDNCWIASNALVMDTNVPSDSIAIGQPPNFEIKPSRLDVRQWLLNGAHSKIPERKP